MDSTGERLSLSSYRMVVLFGLATAFVRAETLDTTNLLRHYIHVCGFDYLCNKSVLDISIGPDLNYTNGNICPKCRCDDLCLKFGNCCPDLFFALPDQVCNDLFILDPPITDIKINASSYQIVQSCPSGTNQTLYTLCNHARFDSLIYEITNVPVSGSKFNIAYRNKYCAECNNELNVTDWNLKIECQLFGDYNFLSSYEEIIQQAKDRLCGITFTPGTLPVHICPKDTDYDMIINHCNTTGYWSHYDPDIEKACESTYHNKFRIFKNIFCYMCNPSKHYSKNIVSKCNSTKFWKPKDKGLEASCKFYNFTQHTKPFKNVFCFLCNKNNVDQNIYLDMNVQLKENYFQNQTEEKYNYYIQTISVNREYLTDLIKTISLENTMIQVAQSRSEYQRVLPNGRSINVTHLIRKHFAQTGNYEYCSSRNIDPNKWFLPVFQRCCSCNINYILQNENSVPCIDMSLRYPVQCKSYHWFTDKQIPIYENVLYMTNGCFLKNSSRILKQKCESTTISDIFGLLPTEIIHGNILYKNTYCYLCNAGVLGITSDEIITEDGSKVNFNRFLLNIKLWNVDIRCNDILDYSHYVTMFDFLSTARHMKCYIRFESKSDIPTPKKCKFHKKGINKCNITGHWSSYDADVEWACTGDDHDFLPLDKPFRNTFCRLCNPKYTNNTVISTCNITGQWKNYSPNIERACRIYPRTDTTFPYKNHFCRICNFIPPRDLAKGQISTTTPTPTSSDSKHDYILTYRSIFALNYNDDRDNSEVNTTCHRNQIYDTVKNICRNVTCYPGKRLGNAMCYPLLTVTSKLRYVLAFGMVATKNERTYKTIYYRTNEFFGIIQNDLMDNIKRLCKVKQVLFHSAHFLSNNKCNYWSGNASSFRILLYINLFIEGFVDRLETENILFDIGNGGYNIFIYGMNLTSVKSKEAFYLPLHLNKADLANTCYLGYGNFTYMPHEYFKSTFIDKVMLCKQVELDVDEFELDAFTMILKYKEVTFEYDQYKFMENKKARICLDDLKFTTPYTRDFRSVALGILTTVCVSISLLCLTATFITYCLFNQLRTLPGKNIMLLIFAIFWTQVCFVAGFFTSKFREACIINAILSHLFWLLTFGCMSVCSFHMYRVFRGTKLFVTTLSHNNRMFRQYMLYAFGFPVIVVVVNIAVHLGITYGESTGYDGSNCFIRNKTTLIVTLLIPILSICITNIFFFAATANYLRQTPKIRSNKMEQRELKIYLKLFALTGIMWLFQILDALLPLSAFSFVVTCLNGLQGLFIFLSYSCNSRVFSLYKHLLFSNKSQENIRCRDQINTSITNTNSALS